MVEVLDRLLQASTETEVLEFKEAKNQYDKNKLGKYFSALSNEANLKGLAIAWLLFGVNNAKEIVGTNISDKQLNDYKEEISRNTSPTLGFINTHRLSLTEGDVIMLEIPAAPQGIPVSWKSHYYGRDGESLGGLDIAEIERIRSQRTASDWSATIISNATLSDLSEEAIGAARLYFVNKNPHLKDEIPTWDDVKFLNKAKLTIKGKITNAAILLLGKPESEHFVSPATSKISWILKDRDGIVKDYEHFSCPLLLSVEKVYSKIRNIKYRYIKDDSLFPEEVNQYDPYIVREAINNCIAHQDYTLGGKVNVVENEDGFLVFLNSGSFIPQTVENVIEADAPEPNYRNSFLANAMVNCKMIDTVGSGIKKMFLIQKDKFFPLPDYDFSNNQVKLRIIGKVVDVNYARKLAQMPDLSLHDIMMLDKVSKKKAITKEETKLLKEKGLIEGRRPNFHISANVALKTGEKADYIKHKGIDDQYIQDIIVEYLKQFKEGKRSDFEKIILDKLSDVLDIDQKRNKIKNSLQSLRSKGVIEVDGKNWKMSKL